MLLRVPGQPARRAGGAMMFRAVRLRTQPDDPSCCCRARMSRLCTAEGVPLCTPS